MFRCVTLRYLYVCRVNGEDVRLMLWDTAGQEEFDAITKAYYRGKEIRKFSTSTPKDKIVLSLWVLFLGSVSTKIFQYSIKVLGVGS